MHIGFFGGGPQAFSALSALVAEPGWTIDFVHPRTDDDLIATELSETFGYAILDVSDVNSEAGLAFIRRFDSDLFVSINEKQVFKSPLLAVPRLGTINLHNGLLPRQRGGGGAYVGLINAEPCGMTIHYVDEGIDSGDIILQQPYQMSSMATMAELMDRILSDTPSMVVAAVRQIENGCVWRRKQTDMPYYYVPAKPDWDELINWEATTAEILSRFRARTPGPQSFYVFGDVRYFVMALEGDPRVAVHANVAGQVIGRSREDGVLVKTSDTAIWIKRVRREGDEYETVPAHKLGSMLRYHLDKEIFDLKARMSAIEKKLS